MPSDSMRSRGSIVFASASIGSGHTRAAIAVHDALAQQPSGESPVLLDAMQHCPAWFRTIYRDGYLAGVRYLPRAIGALYSRTDAARRGASHDRNWIARTEDRLLARFRAREELRTASAVVSTHFLTSGVLARMRTRGELHAPLITVVTDEHPHATWLHRGSDLTCIASESARAVAIAAGLDPLRVVATGIPIDPRLAREPQARRDCPTVLICGGGHGLGEIATVVQSVLAAELRATVIVVCGNNAALRKRIEAFARNATSPTDLRVLGYTNEMHTLMASADLLVGKPGGLTTTEARAVGLPMLLLEAIPGQEEHNASMLVGCGAAVRLRSAADAGSHVAEILADAQLLGRMRAASTAAGRPHAASDIAARVAEIAREHLQSRLKSAALASC